MPSLGSKEALNVIFFFFLDRGRHFFLAGGSQNDVKIIRTVRQTDTKSRNRDLFFLAYRAHRETVKISVAARFAARSNNDIPYHKITQTIQTTNLSIMTIIIVLRDMFHVNFTE